MNIYWESFKTFFKIGIFTLGGGYAMIPLIEEEVVGKKQWVSKDEMLDMIAIAQSYGIPYLALTERRNIAGAVEKMLSTDGPFLLECAIKEEDNVLPMTPPGMSVNEMMLEI